MAFSPRLAALAAVVAIPLGIAATSYAMTDSPDTPKVPPKVELDSTPSRTPGVLPDTTPAPSKSGSPGATPGDAVVPGPSATDGDDDDDRGDDTGEDG
ncbi:small secreted hydrophilic protein [Streptomyces sp. L-9-10]|uniref:small hydrophilic protein n=1 Tax=Streptomyces sp. L-9-10 TaxID=1478131 RepID=UPI00101CFBE8|nr:small hydrophilic protein [Streptomyces sp. L-9-10]RYJ26629.1 small secreted hydrophilic protein [Streptomyces sp. L-9-10]